MLDYFVIIEGEFRSFLRNMFERIFKLRFKNKKRDKRIQMIINLATRVVCSLIAIQIFKLTNNIPNIKMYLSFLMIAIFLYFFIKG
jgi:hypothetical protein